MKPGIITTMPCRYHTLHPDSVPDLRDSRQSAKKHFFFGYHASVFRGWPSMIKTATFINGVHDYCEVVFVRCTCNASFPGLCYVLQMTTVQCIPVFMNEILLWPLQGLFKYIPRAIIIYSSVNGRSLLIKVTTLPHSCRQPIWMAGWLRLFFFYYTSL